MPYVKNVKQVHFVEEVSRQAQPQGALRMLKV